MARISMVLRGDIGGLGSLSRVFHDCFNPYRSLSLSFRAERNDDKFFCAGTNRVIPRGRRPTDDDAAWLVDGADAVVGLETFYGPEVPFAAHRAGVKVVLVPMYEQLPWGGIGNSFVTHAICPNELCRREIQDTRAMHSARTVVLPPPIDTGRIPFRRRERARVFVHFSKEGDRDGTPATLAAWSMVRSDARLIVYVHGEPPTVRDERIEFRSRCSVDYWSDYDDGDALIHCHRYAGYCCTFSEALAAGMPIITTRFWPFCDGAPLPPAVGPIEPDLRERYESSEPGFLPASSQALSIDPMYMRRQVICRPILSFEASPESIAAAVDKAFDTDIAAASEESRAFAESRSFERLAPLWREELAA